MGKTYVVVATGDGLHAAALVPGLLRKNIVVFHADVLLTALHKNYDVSYPLPRYNPYLLFRKWLFVLQDGALLSYNWPVLVSVIQEKSTNESFAGCMRRVSPRDHTVYRQGL